MAFLIRGDLVKLELEDGDIVDVPDDYGLVHDVDGKLLDRCELVICPYNLGGKLDVHLPKNIRNAAISYFGDEKKLVKGSVEIPTGPWQHVGNVVFIYYARHGKRKGLYQHPFETPVPLFKERNSDSYKLKFPDYCVIDSRGFVWP